MSVEQNIEVVDRIWQEIVANGNTEVMDDLVADEYTYRAPGLEIHGPEGFKRYIVALHELFDNIEVTIHEYIAQDDRVLSRWTGKAVHKKTGRDVTWKGATITHVAEGKMIDDWEYWDRMDLAQQLTAGWLEKKVVDYVANQIKKNLPDG